MGLLKRNLVPALLSAVLLLTFSPLVPTAQAVYADAENTWASEVVEKAAAYGLMEGYSDGRFGVGEDMTRAQFVTVLCRMLSWELSAQPDSIHRDCQGHWALPYIDAAAQHGIEDHGGPFRPDDPITRMEMAQMLIQALDYYPLAQDLSGSPLPFSDVEENSGCALLAYDLGLISGVKENGSLRFLPNFSAPREQAAALLVRCYERYTAKTDWLHGFYAFSSYPQLSYAAQMDAVSVGWARLEADEAGTPRVNSTPENGNDWVKPEQSQLTTDFLSQHAIPYNLNVFGSAAAFAALTEAGRQDLAIDLLVSAAAPYAGLTMDVEGLRTEHRESYAAFISALRSALPQNQTLYVCVQPDTWFGGFDYRALGEVCDKVILMAHDYQWSSIPDRYLGTDNTYCPVTPIDQIYTALRHVTDPETGVQDRSKLALAISFNTTGFHVDENGLLLDQTFYHPQSSTIAQRLGQEDSQRVWNRQSRNPCLFYTADGEHYRLWYEDAQSVEEKLRLARMFGISGVSVWRLGMIPDYPDVPYYDVWSVLSQRCGTDTGRFFMMKPARSFLLMSLGTALVSVGVYFFKFPNHFSMGGVSGLSILLGQLIPSHLVTPATINTVITLLFLVLGFLTLDKSFGVKTVYCSLLYSGLIQLFERFFPLSEPLTDQKMLELFFAVILPALGAAILFNMDASTGGTDIMAMILKKYSGMDVGRALLISDVLIAASALLVFDVETGLFALLGLALKSILVDSVIESLNRRKAFTVVTHDPEAACRYINDTLHRGATVWKGQGAYTHQDQYVILTALSRHQAVALRNYLRKNDPQAFMLITNSSEIFGKGFLRA